MIDVPGFEESSEKLDAEFPDLAGEFTCFEDDTLMVEQGGSVGM
ncbi:hypothetical protein ACFL6W_03280 [Thermodesulfobacteriota bacterium]